MIRKFILAGTLAAASFTTAALAQTVVLQPQEQVVVKEYVVKHPPAEVTIPEGYSAVVGEKVPDTITVTPLDAPGLSKQYEYVVIDGRTVLVDPDTREVVQILE
ncbi:DUF1236 domain-containing protein [Mesorhizobium sp. SP-1A]|uniref:DUF1236 domain-containing protein n=1 Tax=Mesorhizobium sp. SP-1A TaxID=3077840 RepID=UPI0028F73436|nr:DUF1236 domain-containing protein [Mesorhizobium sp. SP-1A]